MRILITGANGFIGARLIERLRELGRNDIYAFERHDSESETTAVGDVRMMFGDIRDHDAVKKAVREAQPEIVFHLAALSAVAYGYDHPQEVLDVNLDGTVNLAETCLREIPRFRHFLFASSSAVYGDGPVPLREDSPQTPNNPYAVSKLAAEKYLLYMWQAYAFPVSIIRPFNTYGRRDNTQFLVERIIVQMLSGDLVRLGDPTPERDWLHVDDHVSAYLACLDQPNKSIGETFNICSGESLTVRALAEKLAEMIGFKGQIAWNSFPRRPLDIRVLIGDFGKARTALDWTPKVGIDEGLSRTIEFWRKKLAAEGVLATPR